MNNEYNNNPYDNSGNQVEVRNTETNLYPNSEQYINGAYSTSGNNSNNMDYNNTQGNNYGTSTIYPTPQIVKKKGKKRPIIGIISLTAAAILFGIIAGAAFQGYNLIANFNDNTQEVVDSQATELAQKAEEIIVPAKTTASDMVVTDVSEIVESAMPSIVAINARGVATNYDFFGNEYDQEVQGSGSGIIVGKKESELLIVTNNHVVEGSTNVEIVFSDEETATAVIKGADASADLAVLSVDLKDLSDETTAIIKVARLGDSDNLDVGDMAIAIGNALGYGQSVTVGYISALDREVRINNTELTLLQTDAAINPGNSGGALLNTSGQVIGINSVKYASQDVEGIGYAIPISSAVPLINELVNRESVSTNKQGFLGIDVSTAQNVTEEHSERFKLPIGVYVNDVIEDSPAAKAGLEQGHIIVGVDNVKVKTIDDLINALSYKRAGQNINLKIMVKSDGEYKERILEVTLGKKN